MLLPSALQKTNMHEIVVILTSLSISTAAQPSSFDSNAFLNGTKFHFILHHWGHANLLSLEDKNKKWRCGGSNPVPLACKASTLPFELHPLDILFLAIKDKRRKRKQRSKGTESFMFSCTDENGKWKMDEYIYSHKLKSSPSNEAFQWKQICKTRWVENVRDHLKGSQLGMSDWNTPYYTCGVLDKAKSCASHEC
ncbi:hypothetical protein V6N11_027132 [Hibiscus sabdariffa]|uniref:S-protein homolog n=1 Tax=Hibiscus sabdariffa TaxID=183260 RepID=A0ABR2PG13_9ROSI